MVPKKGKEEKKEQYIEVESQQPQFLKNKPSGHEKYSEADKEKCPIFQIQNKISSQQQNPQSPNEAPTDEKPRQKQKKIKGGCPFMTSEKKRNPALAHLSEAWNYEFVSPQNYLLDYKGINMLSYENFKDNKPKIPLSVDRTTFNSYPIYLKHTIFHAEDPYMIKARKCDVSQKFFVYDSFREQGNKLFYKGFYQEAIVSYERALSCFKWLEIIDEEEEEIKNQIEEASRKKIFESKQNNNNNNFTSNEAFDVIQSKIKENFTNQKQNQQEISQILLKRKLIQNENLSQTPEQFFNQSTSQQQVYNDNNSDIRSDIAIDDDEDHFERELENMKEDLQEERNEQEIKKLMEEEDDPSGERNGQTKVILDKEKEKQIQEEKHQKAEQIFQMRQEDKEFRKKYRTFLTTYTDNNTKLKDGEELTDASDIDLRNSMLLSIYLNLSVAYMKLFHFRQALQALSDAEKICDKASQIYFRRSQALSYNKNSSLKDLKQAKIEIEKAIELKQIERLFQQNDKGVLKILNLENHNEIYVEQAHYVQKRISEFKENQISILNEFLENEQIMEETYKEMIQNGDMPLEEDPEKEKQYKDLVEYEKENTQMDITIIQIMVNKYYDVIEYFQDVQKENQVKLAEKELQSILQVYYNMMFYYNLEFSNNELTQNECLKEANETFKIDFENPRAKRRLDRQKHEKIREVYEGANFNFELFQYALAEYQKMKKKREANILKQQQKNNSKQNNEKPKTKRLSVFNLENLAQILFVLLIIIFITSYYSMDDHPLKSYFRSFK